MDHSTAQRLGGGDVIERVLTTRPTGITEEVDRHPESKRGRWIADEIGAASGGGEDDAVPAAGGGCGSGSADDEDLDSVNCFFLRGGGCGAGAAPPAAAVVPCSIHLPAPRIVGPISQSRPILVGYAFGPKKMSTMGIIMAEASKALEDADYFGGGGEREREQQQEQVPVVAPPPETSSSSGAFAKQQWTCDQQQQQSAVVAAGENANAKLSSSLTKTTEDEATIVTCSTSASIGDNMNRRGGRSQPPCRRLTTAALEEENSRQQLGGGGGGNGRERGRSGGGGGVSTSSMCSGRSSLTDIAAGRAISSPSRQISLGSSSRGATMTVASYFSSAASHYSSCPSVATASVAGGMGGHTPPPVRVSFVPLDLDCPLEEQHGGNFDVILHKLTEDILSVSKNDDGGDDVGAPSHPAASNDDLVGNEFGQGTRKNHAQQKETLSDVDAAHMMSKRTAEERLSRLARYVRENRSCCLVDHPDRIRSLMSRADIATVLSRCLRGVVTKSGVPVRSPRFLVCRGGGGDGDGDGDGDGEAEGRGAGLVDRIDAAPFSYPLIAKPLTAAGTADSHKMVIVLGRGGLGRVEGRRGTPCILQEYLNHDGRLFKVYVLGDDVRVFERTSLPNLPRGEMTDEVASVNGGTCCQFVEFDSQKPYPKLSDFGVTVGSGGCAGGRSQTDGGGVHDEATIPKLDGNGENSISSKEQRASPMGPAAFVTADEIRPVATALRKAFSLELFGFDVLVSSSRDEEGGGGGYGSREMLVVDVNYFPSYKEVSNFPSLLARYLTQRAVGSRQGKRKR